jgi:hypothetical protein
MFRPESVKKGLRFVFPVCARDDYCHIGLRGRKDTRDVVNMAGFLPRLPAPIQIHNSRAAISRALRVTMGRVQMDEDNYKR